MDYFPPATRVRSNGIPADGAGELPGWLGFVGSWVQLSDRRDTAPGIAYPPRRRGSGNFLKAGSDHLQLLGPPSGRGHRQANDAALVRGEGKPMFVEGRPERLG